MNGCHLLRISLPLRSIYTFNNSVIDIKYRRVSSSESVECMGDIKRRQKVHSGTVKGNIYFQGLDVDGKISTKRGVRKCSGFIWLRKES